MNFVTLSKYGSTRLSPRGSTATLCDDEIYVPSFDAEIRRENWTLVDSCAFCGGGFKKILNRLIIRILIGST